MLDAESAEISIHSLVKRETRDCYLIHGFFIDFNPLPRKEGDCLVQHIRTPLLISIHSLVKRETQTYYFTYQTNIISIHSLVKRETFRSPFLPRRRLYFNPLPRKEGDTSTVGCRAAETNFNPLPRKEGDGAAGDLLRQAGHFNPLPRKEGDKTKPAPVPLPEISIHSLVKRETPLWNSYWAERNLFQSTPS